MNYYVYVTVLPNQKFYIGCHSGNPNDNYYGSGRNISDWIKENGKSGLKKYIKLVGNFEDCSKLEKELIEKYIEHPDCLNIKIIGHHLNKNSRNKLLGKIITDETKRKMSENHIGMLGKKHSEETKRKISEIGVGRNHSEDTKKKISDTKKNRQKLECPYCHKLCSISMFNRWHNDNCKFK